MANAIVLTIITLSLLCLTIGIGYFTTYAYKNPNIMDEIKTFSIYFEEYKKVSNYPLKGIPFEILKFLYNIQQRYNLFCISMDLNGELFNDQDGKLEPLHENVLAKVLEISDPTKITEENKKTFAKHFLSIPVTYLRPAIGIKRMDSMYIFSVTPEGANYIETHMK